MNQMTHAEAISVIAEKQEEIESLRQQLAESQAREKALRDALGRIAEIDLNNSWSCQSGMAKEALAIPFDSAAYEDAVKDDLCKVLRQMAEELEEKK